MDDMNADAPERELGAGKDGQPRADCAAHVSAFKKPSDRSRVVPVNRNAYRSTKKPTLSDSGIKRDTDQEDDLIAGATRIMVNEVRVASTYANIVEMSYESYMQRGLPPVTSDVSRYLSKSIPRLSKKDVPEPPPEAWLKMNEDSEGKNVLAVLRTLITASASVAEAMSNVLVKYIRYRLSKMTPEATVSKMATEMPKKSLTEKKNWNKLVGYGTYTSFG
ncbi:hypothetical protein DL768_011111 [Monosporascus sp. mg162]|nr:hypothetical protein DL768_011111 [Monosporascus sp. mg162]